ncbi:dynein axonemal heavy chain 12 [Episyrphus balteatus]|uniref:dynein axonemal heavy chain 12 n=1 Tax=Episyrphus balteatus TaxID=286459 RepID=UPI0024857175|nr:dynein axonemal heavy chain 12 [Episyrphus balteatus]
MSKIFTKKLERLHKPPCDLTMYDNEEYMKNPLLKFRLSDVKEKRHFAFLKQKAAEEKIKLARRARIHLESIRPEKESYYIDQLKIHVRKIPVPKMLMSIENKIKSYAPAQLKIKYPDLVSSYMDEVHTDFDRLMKIFSMKKILRHPEFDDENPEDFNLPRPDFRFKFPGRTPRYAEVFISNRKKLTDKLLIVFPFVRAVLALSESDFPLIIHYFGRNEYLHLSKDLETILLHSYVKACKADIEKRTSFIRWNWYPRIVNIVKKHYRKKTIPMSKWTKAFNCIEGLINRQINNLKMRTLDGLLELCGNAREMPQFKLNVDYDQHRECIDLSPSYENIEAGFCSIALGIAEASTDLEPLRPQINPYLSGHCGEFLPIELNKAYLDEFLEKLKKRVLQTYIPVKKYLKRFQCKYYCLYSREIRADLEEFLEKPRTFEEYFKKIETYFAYIDLLRSEPMREFFEIALINNGPAIDKLRQLAESLIQRITEHIVIEHMRAEKRICDTFEDIKAKALKIPRSTEELLEGAEYMIYVKNTQMAELRDQIQYCLRIGTDLVSLTEMTKEHIDLTVHTINWLRDINEVFELNASQHEQYKFMFEEHLQEVVKKLNKDILEFIPKMTVLDDMCDTDKFREYYILLQNFIDQLKTFDDYIKWINKEEKLYKIPQTQYPTMEVLNEFVYPFATLMRLCIRWLRYYFVWMDGPFEYLEPKFVEETTDNFYKEFLKNQKYYRNKIKQDLIGNPVCRFRGQTEDPDPEQHPVPLKLCAKMINWIKDFRLGVFMVNIMCNPALRKRHWTEMSQIADFDITPDAGTTLRKLINYKLDAKLDSFEIISVSANKELQLQNNLFSMMKEWDTINFPTGPYKETNVQILSNLDDIQALLDDHIIKTLSMRGSAFMKPCEKEVLAWYEKLIRVNRTLEQWGKVQANFLYLLPIFSSKDIIAQMPEEGRLFAQVEQTFKRNMGMVIRNPLVMETGPAVGMLESLDKAVELLEDITNGVNEYLEKKRLYFPRFFFLSNDEMLEILSETKDPLRVQPHLGKCFEGISTLEFDKQLNVLSMNSSEKENIKFVEMVSTSAAGGSVEKWLVGVEEQMLSAVRYQTELSYNDYTTKKLGDWVVDWPQMVVLCVSQIYWAASVHRHLRSTELNAMSEFFKQLNVELTDIVALIRRKDISNLARITIKSLIVINVHAKDVINELIQANVTDESDFAWLSQLRYYWEKDDTLVRIINATVPYANEYLGNSDRLVITPLTDRCYRTLIGAYQLHLNGAPEGPAGTGKTETTKDLAKALAVQCKVFNCSDGLDYKAMGKFFKGLASCGAWACFDEFNRIELEVLSVVAQQILCIIQAVRSNATKFMFEGTELTLNPACYVCITMNPGYAGRSELPDNLKVLFRSVAMMVPDYAMIGEISLYSFGFVNARNLAVKIVTTYRLCSEQLSSQNHYDYGMRAVKSVLSACGNIKKMFPDENEDILLLRSLLDVNLPKFLSFDIPLFEGIISDLFPGIRLPSPDYNLITEAFNRICGEMNLQPTESFLTKVIQTYEMMIVRHGFMMVGEPMAGKTKTLHVLAKILSSLKDSGSSPYFQDVQIGVVNPKAITMNQLYGAFDPVSYEWTDGIVATIFRNFAMDNSSDRKWVIFDGPVDAVWIENMNTVLDDNKKLCLTSGEVVTMTNEMSMIFEVMDLAQASPATVSRCGMIYMETATLGWQTFAKSWLNKCDETWADAEGKIYVMALCSWLLPPCQAFIRRSCTQLLRPGEFSVLRTTFDLFEMLMQEAIEENPEEYQRYMITYFQASILYSIVWGIGGILDTNSRQLFDQFLRKFWSQDEEDKNSIPEAIGKLEIALPSEGLLADYVYMYKQKGTWKYWPELVKKMEPEESASGVQIPTIDTARYMHLLEMHIKHEKKFLLVGPTGTGKSAYIQNMLMNKVSPEKYMSTFITFTVMITANQTQDLIISKLFKLKRGIYGPPKGQTALIFVDDMNMPAKEVYGAQPPLELLRQYFDVGHVYDLKDTSKIFLQNLLIICACGLPGGSRQDVYARFLSHFNIFSINTFAEDTMNRIFVNVLLNGFKKSGHSHDVLSSTQQIVSATQQIYKYVQTELRATPDKSHYIFNPRDISRVVTGCALLKKESVDNKKIFARLWYHEAMRVFYDRLVDENDQRWIFEKLNECIKENFKERMESVFEQYAGEDGQVTLEGVNRMIFGVYMDEDNEPDEKKYEEVVSLEAFSKVAYQNLEEYNATRRTKMDIALFTYALQHLNKICRIISIQGGSALLVGIGGSGRQSLTKLAATICGTSLFQPEITKNYGVNDWHDDIKNILKEAGGIGKHTVFLMTENQIKMELFLQDIDCLLNQGEVPNIYAIDEKQELLELVRLAAQGGNRNIDISPLQVFSYFVNRCRQKLHIILCFSPIGDSLRTRIRLYPSLVNCCTIDWFQIWPEDALQMVAKISMEDVNVEPEVKEAIVVSCQYFHLSANDVIKEFFAETNRIVYITSASFLELIRSFRTLVSRKQTETMEAKMRYIGGLETLKVAAEAISVMQIQLNALQPKLLEMANASRRMMEEINTETIAASAAAEQVKKDEIVAGAQAKAAQSLKDECEKDLAQAIPVLEEAISALNTLKPADITLVKSMKNPPSVIKLVMAAVCVIKGVPADRINDPATGKMVNDYWGPSKRILGDMNFLQALKDFDKDNISPEIMKKIRKDFIPHKDFQPKIVAKASSAAEGLCKWIIAMDLYDNVAKVVAPKKAKLQAAEKEYSDTMQILNEKREMAEALERKVALLNEHLEKANMEMQRTQDVADLCQNKLMRAEALIGGLGGEKSRWTEAAETLQATYDHLPGDILLSCGIIAYLATLTAPFRNRCIENWFEKCQSLNIPCSTVYSIISSLGTEIAIQQWNIYGLPRDVFSSENAIISANSGRYSLFIDPQGQANKWIKNMERNNRLKVVKFSQKNYMKVIETSLESGQPVLIENILEELEVPLDPILLKNTFVQGGQEFVSLGDNVVPISKNFRLYMTCNLRNPHFLPETYNKVTIINFALTQSGLEDQLLSIVVAKERPDLQEMREALTEQAAKNKAALKDAEDMILKTLSSSQGDILEDEGAIRILDESKNLSVDIVAKQLASKETEEKIDAFRLNYKPVAAHSSILYYTITDLPNIDPMYQFSLNWYINLYMYSIENANKSKDLARRVKFLVDAITQNLYNNVCRSIFEKDKLLYSFILTTKLMLDTKQIEMAHVMHLLTGGGTEDVVDDQPNPDPSWISDIVWQCIRKLEHLPVFRSFVESFKTNLKEWREYYDHSDPQTLALPSIWETKCTRFEKILILQAFRPDKIFMAINLFIVAELGVKFVSPPPFDIGNSFQESNCLTPLIFILSPGADPMGSLLLFAERMGFDETFKSISLGQGQGPIAMKMIEEAQESGYWVCLQNCHLAASWMPTLEYMWENMDSYNTFPTFRLWLTSYPSDEFPVSLLQNGVKMTNEPPTGLQQNLIRSYNSEPMNDDKFYTGCPKQDRAFTRLLYGICFFHAVVQERRKFGPLGWNIQYGFNESDFQISVQQLHMFLNQYDHVPYAAISYLTAECNYGGRVTDAWDRRAIITILADYVNEQAATNHRYMFANDDAYILPRKTEHREILRYINEYIPSLPPPEVYGLHSNAGITRDLQMTNTLLDSMILTLGSSSADASDENSEASLLATIHQIQSNMPPEFDIEKAKEKYPVDYKESMNTVIVQEMERFAKLQKEIIGTCVELQKAIKGISVMTPQLELVIQAIQFKKVPTKWMSKSYPSLKPLSSYIVDFYKRLKWLQDWYDHGKPATFWISGFFFTQAFLTGAMQNFARKYKIPIDTLTFDFVVLDSKSMEIPPEDGVYINGIFLEGARWNWDKHLLDEQIPKILIADVPVIHLMPVLTVKLDEGTRYKCPLYKTSERKGILSTTGHSTNYVIPILLETLVPATHWVKRSAALICQTNT